MIFDTNFWKSFVQERFAVALGDHGSLTLFGEDPTHHRLFSDHLTGEYRIQTSGRGRTVDEWKDRPEQPDNHWLDCLVGASMAASMLGISQLGEKPKGGERRMVKFSDLQKRRGSERWASRIPIATPQHLGTLDAVRDLQGENHLRNIVAIARNGQDLKWLLTHRASMIRTRPALAGF